MPEPWLRFATANCLNVEAEQDELVSRLRDSVGDGVRQEIVLRDFPVARTHLEGE
jgi:hypothetical protein